MKPFHSLMLPLIAGLIAVAVSIWYPAPPEPEDGFPLPSDRFPEFRRTVNDAGFVCQDVAKALTRRLYVFVDCGAQGRYRITTLSDGRPQVVRD